MSEAIQNLRAGIDCRADEWARMTIDMRRFLLVKAGAASVDVARYRLAVSAGQERGAIEHSQAGKLARLSWFDLPQEWRLRCIGAAGNLVAVYGRLA